MAHRLRGNHPGVVRREPRRRRDRRPCRRAVRHGGHRIRDTSSASSTNSRSRPSRARMNRSLPDRPDHSTSSWSASAMSADLHRRAPAAGPPQRAGPQTGAGIRVSSAGTTLWSVGRWTSAPGWYSSLDSGPRDFAASALTSGHVSRADLLLTATRELRSRVLEDAPRALRRTFTLREFAALAPLATLAGPSGARGLPGLVAEAASWRGGARPVAGYDVPDPVGASIADHRDVAWLLDTEIAPDRRGPGTGRLTGRSGLLSGVG